MSAQASKHDISTSRASSGRIDNHTEGPGWANAWAIRSLSQVIRSSRSDLGQCSDNKAARSFKVQKALRRIGLSSAPLQACTDHDWGTERRQTTTPSGLSSSRNSCPGSCPSRSAVCCGRKDGAKCSRRTYPVHSPSSRACARLICIARCCSLSGHGGGSHTPREIDKNEAPATPATTRRAPLPCCSPPSPCSLPSRQPALRRPTHRPSTRATSRARSHCKDPGMASRLPS